MAELHRQQATWPTMLLLLLVPAALLLAPAQAARPVAASSKRHGRKLASNAGWATPTPAIDTNARCPTTAVPPNNLAAGWTTLWVDPGTAVADGLRNGDASKPFRTFREAWNSDRVPKFVKLTKGIRFYLKPGVVLPGSDGLWMEGVWGTRLAPVVITRAPNVAGGAAVLGNIDVRGCTYLYFHNVTFLQFPGSCDNGCGDIVHFASCDYIYLLKVTIEGIKGLNPADDVYANDELLKVNQVTGMYVEDCNIGHSGSNSNAIDFVATQYGHVCRSELHHADWCVYFKGGSSYLLVDSNSIHDCYQSGLAAGQGTGFEYMVPPWLNYEANNLRFTNNIIADVWGACLGVFGGYNILMAHNTLRTCGSRSHSFEVVHGSRGCDGDDDSACAAHQAAGGWGPAASGGDAYENIPSRNVYIYNNLLINDNGVVSQWSHFSVAGPRTDTGSPGLPPSPQRTTAGLKIAGNVFLDDPSRPEGPDFLGLSEVCPNAAGSTCSSAYVYSHNLINTPAIADLAFADRTTLKLTAQSYAQIKCLGTTIPQFPAWATPIATPAGYRPGAVVWARNNTARNASCVTPGAWLM